MGAAAVMRAKYGWRRLLVMSDDPSAVEEIRAQAALVAIPFTPSAHGSVRHLPFARSPAASTS